MKFDEVLGYFEFEYKEYKDGYGLVDVTGVNLGDIESERYSNPLSLIDRLYEGIYSDDYIFSDEELELEGCETIEEYVEKFGNDKEGHDILYYCLHQEELEDIPPILKYAEDIRDTAFELANDHLEKLIDEKVCEGYLKPSYIKEDNHSLEAYMFKSREDEDAFMSGRNFNVDYKHLSVDTDNFLDKAEELVMKEENKEDIER